MAVTSLVTTQDKTWHRHSIGDDKSTYQMPAHTQKHATSDRIIMTQPSNVGLYDMLSIARAPREAIIIDPTDCHTLTHIHCLPVKYHTLLTDELWVNRVLRTVIQNRHFTQMSRRRKTRQFSRQSSGHASHCECTPEGHADAPTIGGATYYKLISRKREAGMR